MIFPRTHAFYDEGARDEWRGFDWTNRVPNYRNISQWSNATDDVINAEAAGVVPPNFPPPGGGPPPPPDGGDGDDGDDFGGDGHDGDGPGEHTSAEKKQGCIYGGAKAIHYEGQANTSHYN